MAQLKIQGGTPLKGDISLCGAKNASFKLMVASLLSPQQVKLSNLSQIADVDLTKKILASLGCQLTQTNQRSLSLTAARLTSSTVPQDLGTASRASSLFIAPLLARTKQAIVPVPGGDQIGKRPLDRHLNGLKAMGARIELKNGLYQASCNQLQGASYRFPKNTHTGTETMLMAAVLAKGKTKLQNAAQEPEVDDLIQLLNRMGAKITRKPNRVIEIQGVKSLHSAEHQLMPDRNEAVSYAVAALVTRGDITINNAQPSHLAIFLEKLTQAGAGLETKNNSIRFFYRQPLKAVDITTQPHPGFMTDWQPLWSVLATQSQGSSAIIETIFTSRFQYVKDLQAMGAQIKFFQPQPAQPDQYYNFNLQDDQPGNYHGINIIGPTPLIGKQVTVTDIRAGATLALAGLAAQGETILTNIEHIDRGYENFAGRLLSLGAKIKRQ